MAESDSKSQLRKAKFEKVLQPLTCLDGDGTVDLNALRELLWAGAPSDTPHIRSQAWTLMLGVAPNARDRYQTTLDKRRNEYADLSKKSVENVQEEQVLSRQIKVDLPRTNVGHLNHLLDHPALLDLMERVLFVWAIRHPACGYVQGINDILVPFLIIYLAAEQGVSSFDELDIDVIIKKDPNAMARVEADVYACLSKILDTVQDYYTSGQPGIQRMVKRLKDIVKRIDEPLYNHLEAQGLDFLQFSFRWFNCLLAREFPLNCAVRLWDTYISEATASAASGGTASDFSLFHVYLCSVFLVYWSPQLKVMDFQQLLMFMQRLPTAKWGNKEIETLLAEAFVLKSLFHTSPQHLK